MLFRTLLVCVVVLLSVCTVYAQAPAATYINYRPPNHYIPVIAKRALPSELKDLDKKEWGTITSLLKTEPAAAGTNDLDMQLDDLEKKYLKEPTDASFSESSSVITAIDEPSTTNSNAAIEATLQSKLAELKDILPKQEMRLKQLKQKLGLSQAPATPSPPAASPSKKKSKVKPFTKDFKKESAQKELAKDAVSTLALIDKRVNSLSRLVKRLHQQLGVKQGKRLSPKQLVEKALVDRKKELKQDAANMAEMKVDKALKAFVETDSHADADAETEQSTDADAEVDVDAEADAEAEVEGESQVDVDAEGEMDAESELQADAEAVDDILGELM